LLRRPGRDIARESPGLRRAQCLTPKLLGLQRYRGERKPLREGAIGIGGRAEALQVVVEAKLIFENEVTGYTPEHITLNILVLIFLDI